MEDKISPLAIVIGRNYTTRLTLARAAGLVGCDVVLIQTNRKKSSSQKIDRRSLYIVDVHSCPEPNEDLLIDTIRGYKDNGGKVILVPADDYAAYVVDKHLNELKPHFLVPSVDGRQGAVLKIMDKGFQKEIAVKVGMNVAKGWVVQCINEEYVIPDGIVYPCFMKPLESYSAPLKNYLKKCDNETELKLLLGRIARFYHLPILVEQFINIDQEYGVQGASFADRSVFPSIVRKDRSLRGITASGKIFPISAKKGLQEKLTAFLKETRFTGIFDVDLFESGGKIFFNELNVRLGANGFAMTYGVSNIPGLFFKYLLGEKEGNDQGPVDFEPKSFVSEQVVREMYYDGIISFGDYRRTIQNADIFALQLKGDMGPYKEFSKMDWLLPIWIKLRKLKKR